MPQEIDMEEVAINMAGLGASFFTEVDNHGDPWAMTNYYRNMDAADGFLGIISQVLRPAVTGICKYRMSMPDPKVWDHPGLYEVWDAVAVALFTEMCNKNEGHFLQFDPEKIALITIEKLMKGGNDA